ncbi:aminotransferase class V-fold PLP-dependent enzyme, partial [Nocardioides marmoraquaticus]
AAAGRLLGSDPAGVAFTESATASLVALLRAWPLPAHARVGVPPASWGPNLALVEHEGHDLVLLPADADGVVDLEALGRLLRDDPPDLLLLDQVASHRGLVQPVGEVVALAREHGLPVWVDAAQALGHVDCAVGADAVVATSRKWLAGPRGVGLLAVAPAWRERLHVAPHPGEPDADAVARLESREAFVAGRLGLGVALAEHEAAGPATVATRLTEVGARVRALVDDLPGWRVVGPGSPAGSITGLAPTAGQDAAAVQRRLREEHGVATALCLPWRAPHDPLVTPSIRVSGGRDTTDDDLERLAGALRTTDP